MDFTIKTYRKLLATLQTNGYVFMRLVDYLHLSGNSHINKLIILRHDVDEMPINALKIAMAEFEMGIKATYYFRIVKQSNNPEIIRKIVAMGHEIGYHYEDLATANGDYGKAIDTFKKHLRYFNGFYPVKTVCMHGSSTSKYDNRDLWNKYKLEHYGLIGEPYLSIDFSTVFYLTDTGYAWDGGKYATRDIVENTFGLKFHTTEEIISCIKTGKFPNQTMILVHTLWTDNYLAWMMLHIREYVRNHVKYLAKHNKLVSVLYRKMVTLYWNNPNNMIDNEQI